MQRRRYCIIVQSSSTGIVSYPQQVDTLSARETLGTMAAPGAAPDVQEGELLAPPMLGILCERRVLLSFLTLSSSNSIFYTWYILAVRCDFDT